MGMTKVVKQAKLLDKLSAKLSHMIAVMQPYEFISTYCMYGGILIFVQFIDTGLMENFLLVIYAFMKEYCV